MSYKNQVLKLDEIINPEVSVELIAKNRTIGEVLIPALPAGVTINLRFGQSSDDIPISSPISFSPTGEEANSGLYWNNPVAVPGGRINVIITAGKGEAAAAGESRNAPPFTDVGRPPFSH